MCVLAHGFANILGTVRGRGLVVGSGLHNMEACVTTAVSVPGSIGLHYIGAQHGVLRIAGELASLQVVLVQAESVASF